MSAALDRAMGTARTAPHTKRRETYPCACAFAKAVGDTNPCHFPRVGIEDNVLYQGHWIVRHTLTGQEATIYRLGAPALHAEADECCFDYFDGGRAG